MNLILLRLCLATVLLVVFVQAQYDKLTPQQRKELFKAIGGSVGNKSGSKLICSGNSCGPGYICSPFNGVNRCVIPAGKKCNFNDKCEGGYYCQSRGTCSGSGRQKEGEICITETGQLECENFLYCDLNVGKCLLNLHDGIHCTQPSDCKERCGDCTCSNFKCVPL